MFENSRGFLLFGFLLLFFLPLQSEGQDNFPPDGSSSVVTGILDYEKQVRILYDAGNYTQIYKILKEVYESMDVEALKSLSQFAQFHYLLLYSAMKIKATATVQKYYTDSIDSLGWFRSMQEYEQNHIDKAISYAETVASRSNNLYLEYYLGELYYMSGQDQKGNASFTVARSLSWPYAHYYYAMILYGRGEFKDAVSEFRRILSGLYEEEKKLQFYARLYLADSLYHLQEYREAANISLELYKLKSYETIIVIDPGMALALSGQVVEAQDFWKKAKKDLASNSKVVNMIQSRVRYWDAKMKSLASS